MLSGGVKVVEKDIERIKEIIADVKPRFTMFGGDVEFLEIADGKVKVRPTGYCYR